MNDTPVRTERWRVGYEGKPPAAITKFVQIPGMVLDAGVVGQCGDGRHVVSRVIRQGATVACGCGGLAVTLQGVFLETRTEAA